MISKYTVTMDYTVKMAVEKMTEENIKAVVVLDKDGTVIGLFANGDMRRFYLSGGSLSDNICKAMNMSPKLYKNRNEVEMERLHFNRVIYPIVNDKAELIDILDYDNAKSEGVISEELKDVPLVIMAGGKGTRLYPYTKVLPKPLIPIGDVTITERIINSFCKYGCQNVFMILNYKAGMIKAYMSDIPKNYKLEYVKEEVFLGTAGGLSLIKEKVKETFFMSNCDILINDDLECVYKTHKARKNKITFVCSMKDVVIPYGVVETNQEGYITNIQEKPNYSHLVNTGVYLI